MFGSLHRPLNKCPVGPWAMPWSFHCGRSVSFFPKNPTLNFSVPLFSLYNPAVSCSLLLGWAYCAGRPGSKTILWHSAAIAQFQILCPLGALFLHLQNGSTFPCLPTQAMERIRWPDCFFPFWKHKRMVMSWAVAPGCSLVGLTGVRVREWPGLMLRQNADPVIPSLSLALGPPTTFPAILLLPHLKTTQQEKGESISLYKALSFSLWNRSFGESSEWAVTQCLVCGIPRTYDHSEGSR